MIKWNCLSVQFYIYPGIFIAITVSKDVAITSEGSLENYSIYWIIFVSILH